MERCPRGEGRERMGVAGEEMTVVGGEAVKRRRWRKPLQVYKWEVKTLTVRHYTTAILQPVCLALPLLPNR